LPKILPNDVNPTIIERMRIESLTFLQLTVIANNHNALPVLPNVLNHKCSILCIIFSPEYQNYNNLREMTQLFKHYQIESTKKILPLGIFFMTFSIDTVVLISLACLFKSFKHY
jgi:D-alanyl-lipoteichoic acid acyltransferase DltB (MBOAT superfamily)